MDGCGEVKSKLDVELHSYFIFLADGLTCLVLAKILVIGLFLLEKIIMKNRDPQMMKIS